MNEINTHQISTQITVYISKILKEISEVQILINKNINNSSQKNSDDILDEISRISTDINNNKNNAANEYLEHILYLLKQKESFPLAALQALLKLLIELLRIENLPLIAMTAVGSNSSIKSINCYPGLPGADCHELAIFISLSSAKYKNYAKGSKSKHLSFSDALEKIVQHMQGYCFKQTKTAILITDSWDADIFSKWQSNLQVIRDTNKTVDCYLMTGTQLTPIKF